MKNLVHLYMEQHPETPYATIPQKEFLERLAQKADIVVSAQTLRNWEMRNLLTTPSRSGESKARGLIVKYSEFALAEAFATYKLTNANLSFGTAKNNVSFPKYSLLHVEMARRAFCKAEGVVPNFPAPPKATYHITYNQKNLEELFNDLPPFIFKFDDGECHVNLSMTISDDVKELAKNLFYQGLYSAWFFAMREGCTTFFGPKKLWDFSKCH